MIGTAYANAADADSIRDPDGLAMLRGNWKLQITTKEDTLLCR
jgi:hypothetical protein